MAGTRLVIDPAAIASPDGSRGLEIYVPGFRHDSAVAEEAGTQVYLEIVGGRLAVHVWDGGEDPKVTVPIARNGDAPAEDDASLTTSELAEKYGRWSEHPVYSASDWQIQVGNNDTRHGYWDWVASEIEADADAKPAEKGKAQ